MIKKIFTALIILTSVLVFSQYSTAQVRNTDITLSVYPLHPNPSEEVNLKVGSYSIDLSKAYISWWVDNQEVSRGVGQKEFSLTTGSAGTNTSIYVNIDTISGQSLTKSVNILSNNIDILWEATESYTPPFYKGKALGTKESYLKAVAIPNIIMDDKNINIENFSYKWKKDDKVQVKSSGWSKNSLIFKNSFLDNSNIIEVEVSDIYGNTVGKNKIEIKTTEPKIVLYEKDPEKGISIERAITEGKNIGTEKITIEAIPYFFSTTEIDFKDLDFKWELKNKEIFNNIPKNELTVVGEEGRSGSDIISVEVTKPKTLYQTASNLVELSF